MIRLLDVNILIGLLDSAHVHHKLTVSWFRSVAVVGGWATCPITENGFIRIVSHVSYPNLRLTPSMAADSIARLKAGFPQSHRFWPAQISLSDPEIFDLSILTASRQTTDACLAGVAFRNSGRFATLDNSIPWRAVRGAGSDLVENIGP